MSDFFIGDIRWFPYNKIPRGWHICDGALLNVQSNVALYTVIGFAYGGDGKTTFGLPDLRGRTIIGSGYNYPIGKTLGAETVTITTVQMPPHNHAVTAATDTGNAPIPSEDAVYASPPANPKTPDLNIYGTPTTTSSVALASSTVTSSGGGQGHPNMQPFLTLTACIAVQGLYPQFD